MKTPLFFLLLISGATVYGQSAKKLNRQLIAAFDSERYKQDSLLVVFIKEHDQLGLLKGKLRNVIDQLDKEERSANKLSLVVDKQTKELKKLGVDPNLIGDSTWFGFSSHQEMSHSIREILNTDYTFSEVSASLNLDGLKKKEQNELLAQKINEYKRYSTDNRIGIFQLESQQQQLEPVLEKLNSMYPIYHAAIRTLTSKSSKLEQKLAELRENYRLKGPKGFPDAYQEVFPGIHPVVREIVPKESKESYDFPKTLKEYLSYEEIPPPVKITSNNREQEIYTVVDEPASFPGGTGCLLRFIFENLYYPQSAMEMGIQGKVYLKFIVSDKGEISNITFLRKTPDCPECDEEAMRLVKSMPKWIPAKNDGKPVNSYFHLPITFKLN